MNTSLFKKWYPKLFAKPAFHKMNVALVRYGLRGLGILNYANHSLTGENHFLSWFINTHNPNIIFDVGANKGDYARLCRKHGFTNHIYGFEPNPLAYRNLKNDKKHHFFNIGFSDSSGSFQLFYEKGKDESTHATLYKDSIDNLKAKIVSCEVELKTLDEFVLEQAIDHIDLLKIDTEGNEYKILKGAKKTLNSGKIKAIQFEITGINLWSSLPTKILSQYVNKKKTKHEFETSNITTAFSNTYLLSK